MKKITLPKFSKIFFIISGVLLFIYFLLSVLEKLNIYIYWAGISTQEILPSAKILLILSLTSAFTVLMFKKIRHKALRIALAVIISVSSLVYCIMVDFSELSDSKYYEYTSDDKSHHIVVNEWSWLLAGGGRVYEKTSFCTIKRLATILQMTAFVRYQRTLFTLFGTKTTLNYTMLFLAAWIANRCIKLLKWNMQNKTFINTSTFQRKK